MRRHAKAPSAAEAMHSGTGRGLGSGHRRIALLALLAALSLALLAAPAAWANGNVEVSVVGSGSGTVTSTSEQIAFDIPLGSGMVTPGQINCNKAGVPVCGANFANEFASFGETQVKVTLTATPDPSGGPFVGWAQADGTPSTRCATPPDADPTCVLTLNGTPGPSAKVFAVFGALPGPPSVVTDGTSPASAFHFATLEGHVNPNGIALLDCRFLYGTTDEYGRSAPCVPSTSAIGNGTSDVAVAAAAGPLEPDTTYHFRLRATGALGAADEGEDMTFTTGPAPSDNCPNADVRAQQGTSAILLPDCMALEQVSPPVKENQTAKIYKVDFRAFGTVFYGGISPDGNRVMFNSKAALGGTPAMLDPFGDNYVATRSPGQQHWTTSSTTPPTGILEGWQRLPNARSFSSDYSSWYQLVSLSPTLFNQGIGQVFRGGLGGAFDPTTPPLIAANGSAVPYLDVQDASDEGSSADQSHFYFRPGPKDASDASFYLPGDPSPSGFGTRKNTYLAALDSNGNPSLRLLARDGDGKVWGGNCGAGVAEDIVNVRKQGAISADGSRTFFTTRPSQPFDSVTGDGPPCEGATHGRRIMVREETPSGIEIHELFASPSGAGNDAYEGASFEGEKVLFATTRGLVGSDSDSGATDLYLFDSAEPAGEELTNLSGTGTAVPVLAALSGDGSHVYFTSGEILTAAPSPEGKVAQAGQENLYLFERSPAHPDGRIAFIGTTFAIGAGGATAGAWTVPMLGPDPAALGVGGDGRFLLFGSDAALTVDDTDGSHADVFRYDAEAETLLRISKPMPGGADGGAFAAVVGGAPATFGGSSDNAPDIATRGRWVSEDGETIAFKTAEGLLPSDGNGTMDDYLWRQGSLYLLPGTTDESGKLNDRPMVSLDGDTVAFQTFVKLVPGDGDTAADVYVARVGGGFLSVPAPALCVAGEDCQGADTAPAAPIATSAALTGHGNLRQAAPRPRCPKGKRWVKRNGKARCIKRSRTANNNRRAGK